MISQPSATRLADDVHDVEGVCEHDQVGEQGVELDQLLLLIGVVVGEHAVVPEGQPVGEPVVGLHLVGRGGDPRPQLRVGKVAQQSHCPYAAADLAEHLVDAVLAGVGPQPAHQRGRAEDGAHLGLRVVLDLGKGQGAVLRVTNPKRHGAGQTGKSPRRRRSAAGRMARRERRHLLTRRARLPVRDCAGRRSPGRPRGGTGRSPGRPCHGHGPSPGRPRGGTGPSPGRPCHGHGPSPGRPRGGMGPRP